MKIFTSIVLLLLSVASFANTNELDELLKLTPGESSEDIPKNFENDQFYFEAETKNNKIVSIDLTFKNPPESKKFLKINQKGFCITQMPAGDVNLPNLYFIDTTLKKRFKLTPDSKIKKITIFDFSEIDKSLSCNFESLMKVMK